MARRKSLSRKRSLDRKSVDSVGSGLLDSDTSVLDEERTFWWNHLQENTFPLHTLIQSKNETARKLNDSSRMDSTPGSSEWWKNLDHSDSEHAASTSSRRKLSAVMIKSNILQSSTSESEKEDLRKKKVHLKGTNSRKSTNNAFSSALDDTEVAVPLKLQKKRAHYSDVYSDSDREVSQGRLQEDEEDDNPSPTGNILKSKSSISQKRRDESAKGQNLFQDILMGDSVLNDSNTRRSVALQKESSRHSMHRDIDTSKAHADDQRKSMRASRTIESRETDSPNLLAPNAAVLESNTNESAQSSEESETKISHNKYLKLKSHFMQRVRKSVGKNAFADALADDGSASVSTDDPNNENDTHKSPLTTRSLSLSKRSVNRSKTKDITHEDSLIFKSPRSLNAAKKQSLDGPVQAQDNIEANSSSSSLDDNESRKKKSIFLKPKSRILKSLPSKSLTKNAYEEILEEESNISVRKSNASIKHASFERDETRIGQARSLTLEKSSQSKSNKTINAEDSSDISLVTLSNGEKDVSEKSNVSVKNKSKLLEKSSLTNASKSSSQTNTNAVLEMSEKEASSSRKPTKEETLRKEHANAILTDDSTSSSKIVTHENISDDSRDDIDVEHDSSMPKRVSNSNSVKEARLMRNSLRNRSETPKLANIGIHKVIDNSRNDANVEHDSSMSKRVSKSSPAKEARLMRNSLRNRSETPQSVNIAIHEVIDNPRDDANKEHDSSMSKRVSKSSPAEETRLTHNSLRNRSEIPAKDMELSKQSRNWIADIEEDDNANAELNIDDIIQVSSTRISKVSANVGIRKSTILSAEVEMTDDEDADSGMQTIERNSTSTKATGNRTINRQSVESTNRTSISKEGKETTDRQKSLGKSQSSIPIKASGKDISSKASSSKLNSSKSLRKIDDFFKVKQSSTTMDKQPNERVQKSQFDTEKLERIKTELERIKNREMAAMKIATDKKESDEKKLKTKNVLSITLKQATKKKRLANPTKVVDKAFLVNGEIYKAPRLPRPKHWATDRLYKFLWKHMEPKYKLATRLKSEKFVQELAKMIAFIERRKNYENYKSEIEVLMKEMARLKIINTRNDFYHFCQDFLPYEFRVKVVPMLLPGNKMNIPYDPEKLHIPLLDT